ncbi:MAG: glycosyl transferase family 2 [Bacteroidetes bacterium HGW-Bacteroidetes-2]|jgi:glycosyltransferase involved in cell wall biosynthesis|nr:MAG: glycosyl transferase family 2 [Bacteroidetes bacterium HGW-Bacteroidetes-2]
MNLYVSFIVPVYNRPEEIHELLESFVMQNEPSKYEIVIVEDGSNETSEKIVDSFKNKLQISYYFKPNTGPGDSRNFGMNKAKGNFFILLDSDCILPPNYVCALNEALSIKQIECFGGPDAAHNNFSDLQKAINYTMTSYLTTGGIRGKNNAVHKFEPRSFNMGLSKKAFEATGGFGKIHPGEDPDLSLRLRKAGFESHFIKEVFVYHKRRISWSSFYKQVKKFGLVRPILSSWHPESAKITFWFPSFFVLFFFFSIFCLFFGFWQFILILGVYFLLIFIDSSRANNNIKIGLLSVKAICFQFLGYGLAFLKSTFFIRFLKQDPKRKFPELFFD